MPGTKYESHPLCEGVGAWKGTPVLKILFISRLPYHPSIIRQTKQPSRHSARPRFLPVYRETRRNIQPVTWLSELSGWGSHTRTNEKNGLALAATVGQDPRNNAFQLIS